MSETFPDEDRCTDPIDLACQLEQRMRENDLAQARARSRPEQVQVPMIGPDGEPMRHTDGSVAMMWPITECVDCGDEIPEARLAHAKIRCIICQGVLETKEKLRAR